MRRWLAVPISVAALATGLAAGRQTPAPASLRAELATEARSQGSSAAAMPWTPTADCPLEDCSAPSPPSAALQPTQRAVAAQQRAITKPAVVAPTARAQAPITPPPFALQTVSGWQDRGFVAHAFGSPDDGRTYTNSFEAFDRSYRNGFRTFETDMVRLADGNIVLAHDRFEQRFGLPAGIRFEQVSSDAMAGRRLDGVYPVLFGADFVAVVRSHPDATFILDTKDDHVAIASWLVHHMTTDELDRLRPHVHTQEQIDGLLRLYPWKGFVIASYMWSQDAATIERTAVRLASVNHIDTFMVKPKLYSDELRDKLRAVGVRYIFLHSFTDPEQITTWRSRGLGVYSNGWIDGMPIPAPSSVS